LEETPKTAGDYLETDQIDSLINAAGIAGAQEILNAFWRSTETLLDALAEKVRAGNFEDAAKTAHALKGSAANVGAKRLADAAQTVETACKRSDMKGALAALSETNENVAAVKVCFEEHLKAA